MSFAGRLEDDMFEIRRTVPCPPGANFEAPEVRRTLAEHVKQSDQMVGGGVHIPGANDSSPLNFIAYCRRHKHARTSEEVDADLETALRASREEHASREGYSTPPRKPRKDFSICNLLSSAFSY